MQQDMPQDDDGSPLTPPASTATTPVMKMPRPSISGDDFPTECENDENQVPPTPQMTPALVPKPTPILHRISEERDLRLLNVLKMEPTQFCRHLYSAQELGLQHFIETAPDRATEHKQVIAYTLDADTRLSCSNWRGRCFVTGTDIVRLLTHRYETYVGRKPANVKKFEEGVFSDLRRLSPPKDCVLEGTRSDFLMFLFDYDCVRSKKKQKVFFWSSFVNVHNNLFCDAMDRELARIEMAKAVGMNIDEFIKSGIVPTGSTAHESHRRQLGFDWTMAAETRDPAITDNDGPICTPILSVDQIHFIRNDIAHLFQRHLRLKLFERPQKITPEIIEAAKAYAAIKMGPGVKIDPARRSNAIVERQPKQSRAPRANSDGFADSQDENEYKYPRRSSPAAFSRKITQAQSGRRPGIPLKLKMRRPLPDLNGEYDDEGAYSDSDISSNEGDMRSLYASYKYDQEMLRRNAIVYGGPGATSPPFIIPVMPSDEQSSNEKREGENVQQVEADAKRTKLDGDAALVVQPGELAQKPLIEYEAAYILLGINRSDE